MIKKKVLFVPFVLLIVISVDLLCRCVCTYAFVVAPEGKDTQFGYHTFSQKADIVILGASRANHHYDCNLIQKYSAKSCYNLGHDGMGITQQYLVLKRALKNAPVQIAVLDLSPRQLMVPNSFASTITFGPYYWIDDEVHRMMDKTQGLFYNLRYLSALVQFNGYYKTAISNIHHKDDIYGWSNNGYSPLPYTGEKNTDIPSDAPESFEIDTYGLDILNEIVSLCKENNVKLYVVLSPGLNNWTDFKVWLSDYCKNKNVKFLDYLKYQPILSNQQLFKDRDHMNAKGAEIFTEMVIQEIH